MQPNGLLFVVAAVVTSCLGSAAHAATTQGDRLVAIEEARFTPTGGSDSDLFGFDIAAFGDRIVVGSTRVGHVPVYERLGTTWLESALVTPVNGHANDGFGRSVGLDGDTLVVGATGDTTSGFVGGAIYVFVHGGGGWTQQAKLVPADIEAMDSFGSSVAVSGDTVVASSPSDDDAFPNSPGTNSGSAYIFVRNGTDWSQQAKLVASDTAGSDLFGNDVAISGERVVIGARGKSVIGNFSGAAYVFVREGTSWSEEQIVLPGDLASNDEFGTGVALDEGTALIGSRGSDPLGAAYVFVREGAVWSELTRLEPPGPGGFGRSVALDGDRAVVGSFLDSEADQNAGAAYVFGRESGEWTQQSKLIASDARKFDYFGYSVALAGENVASGAYGNTVGGITSGAAYAIHLYDPVGATEFCFGDGSSGPCPCANAGETGAGCASSTGLGGSLFAGGSTSVGADDLSFNATGLPASQPGLLVVGTELINGNQGAPFGDGLLCLGGQLVRLTTNTSGPVGHIAWGPELASLGGWTVGAALYFQAYYRDPVGSPCGAQFNVTNAVRLSAMP